MDNGSKLIFSVIVEQKEEFLYESPRRLSFVERAFEETLGLGKLSGQLLHGGGALGPAP